MRTEYRSEVKQRVSKGKLLGKLVCMCSINLSKHVFTWIAAADWIGSFGKKVCLCLGLL